MTNSSRIALRISICLLLVGLFAGTARADVASDVLHDLQVSGVPGAEVEIGNPAGIELELQRNDLTAPMLRVTYSPASSLPLTGLLLPYSPDSPLYNQSTGKEIAWDLAVFEAAKHVLASGDSLAGLSLTIMRPGESGEKMITALPPEPPEVQPPATLSLGEVHSRVEEALPSWAATADITVTEDAAGERVVQATVEVPPSAFALLDIQEGGQALGQQQIELMPAGANIGRVIFHVNDPVTKEPLYVAGHDVLAGHLSQWYSPLVSAFARPLRRIASDTPQETIEYAPKDAAAIISELP